MWLDRKYFVSIIKLYGRDFVGFFKGLLKKCFIYLCVCYERKWIVKRVIFFFLEEFEVERGGEEYRKKRLC